MAKKHKHEEHVNHERWLVSYADMVTLLFALFVVLYAMGVTDLEKLRQLKQSIQFAFDFAGTGKTRDTGTFEDTRGAGEVPMPAPLMTAQKGGMKEMLAKTLKDQFEEVSGKSLQIDQTDDTITIRAPLSAFFDANQYAPMKKGVLGWLDKAVLGSIGFTADLRVIIDARDVPIAKQHDGTVITSFQLCNKRLETMRKVITQNPNVASYRVRTEYRETRLDPNEPYVDWEDAAQVILAFSNKRDVGPPEPPR